MKNLRKTLLMVILMSVLASQAQAEAFLGEIRMFAGNYAPRNWAFCDGQQISIAQNNALFAIIGTYYGGDGRTSFKLPDLRGRAPIHAGHGYGLNPATMGQALGHSSVKLKVGDANDPSIVHTPTLAIRFIICTNGIFPSRS